VSEREERRGEDRRGEKRGGERKERKREKGPEPQYSYQEYTLT
jgi:hypothetical protein